MENCGGGGRLRCKSEILDLCDSKRLWIEVIVRFRIEVMQRFSKQYFPNRMPRLLRMEVAVNWQVVKASGGLSGDGRYTGCMSTVAKACRRGGSSYVHGFL